MVTGNKEFESNFQERRSLRGNVTNTDSWFWRMVDFHLRKRKGSTFLNRRQTKICQQNQGLGEISKFLFHNMTTKQKFKKLLNHSKQYQEKELASI